MSNEKECSYLSHKGHLKDNFHLQNHDRDLEMKIMHSAILQNK